jgi:adenylate cyclase
VTFEPGAARQAGEAALGRVRRLMARKAADIILHDPEAAEVALEMGLVDRRWLENPGRVRITTAGPSEVVERFLQRVVETRPSRLSQLGLGAAQLVSTRVAGAEGRTANVTVVFTDLEGFTTFTARQGDEAAIALLRDHHKAAGPVVRREGGRIVKHIGDGLLCTFTDPQGGLRAAVGMLDAAPAPLRLRAGVHVGEAIVSPTDVIGHVVNVAARVAESASGGQVVATLDTVDAAGPTPGVQVGKPRFRRLRGVGERLAVVEVSRDPSNRAVLPSAR